MQKAAKDVMKNSTNPTLRRRANFAIQAKKWHHGQDGLTIPQLPDVELSTLPGNTVPETLQLPDAPPLIGYDGPRKKTKGRNPNYGNIALAGLLALDAVLPGEQTPRPVLKPAMSYNENAYGTGSQAIAEDGITVSKTGYKSNSKDKNKKKLRIPSNKITMEGVPHPVLGIDSQGNQQFMLPGENYQFQGEYVDEIPMAQQGKTVYTDNQKDPRIQAYNDSLILYNDPDHRAVGGPQAFSRLSKYNNQDPAPIIRSNGNIGYTKPVQPVVYNKPYEDVQDMYDLVHEKAITPKIEGLKGRPNPQLPTFKQAGYDNTQPTNYSFTYPTGQGQNGQKTTYFPNESSWRQFTQGQRGASSQSGRGYGTSTGYLQDGGTVFKTQEELDTANALAQGISTRRGLLPGHVGTKVGDAKPVWDIDPSLLNTKVKPKPFNLPNYVQRGDIQTSNGAAWYNDPQTGDVVDVDISVLNQPRFKKPQAEVKTDLMARGLGDGGTLSAGKAKEMLRDGTAHGKKLTKKQKRYFGYVAGGGTPKAENGITILDDSTVKFNGDKHSDASGGIPISYGGKNVMVEGDETGYISPVDDSLTVMGNMKNPLTNRKFKYDSKILSQKEQKMDALEGEGLELIKGNSPLDKWQALKFNSGRVMATGAHQKKKELLSSKEHLKDLQQAMLDLSMEQGVHPEKLFKGGSASYQDGGTIPPSKWRYNNTKTEGLDDKIKQFVTLLEQKGYQGYSGPESGVSKRNTKSGHPSRHSSGEALDMIFNDPAVYDKVLQDPQLTKYLIDNGLTVLNEYDKNVQKKTGASTGHLHIGYDQGTELSGNFRKQASRLYKSSNPDWNWGTRRPVSGQTIKGAPQGDQQYFPYEAPNVEFTPIPATPASPQAPKIPPQSYNPGDSITGVTPYRLPTDAEPLDFLQVAPEAYALATNKREPVFKQNYTPELFQPFQVSFQDKLNENQATFSAFEKASAYNPSALATLGAQKYSADSGVLGDEFRTNQQIANDINNKNIALLNDAELKNLSIGDTQYVRQEQGKSNTKAVNQAAIASVSSKVLQNKANNRKLQVYENLYNFRYNNEDNMNLEYKGPSGAEYINWGGDTTPNNAGGNSSNTTRRNAQGAVQYTSTTTPSPTKTALDEEKLRTLKQKNVNQLLNTGRKTPGGMIDYFDLYQP